MTKSDPIIAVKDVETSANWYINIFGFKLLDPDGYYLTISEFHNYKG